MAKHDIQITVKGKPGSGKSTIIRLLKIALEQKGMGVVIDSAEGEDVAQAHMDNGDYSQSINGLRHAGVTVRIRHKTKKPTPPTGGSSVKLPPREG